MGQVQKEEDFPLCLESDGLDGEIALLRHCWQLKKRLGQGKAIYQDVDRYPGRYSILNP